MWVFFASNATLEKLLFLSYFILVKAYMHFNKNFCKIIKYILHLQVSILWFNKLFILFQIRLGVTVTMNLGLNSFIRKDHKKEK